LKKHLNTAFCGGKERMMDCKYFDGCSAPLCPKDEGIADRTWFPDEDLCRLADVPGWVKRQRKISKKAAPGGYFTVAMLEQDCRIPKGMKGIDPDGTDKERAADEAAWFKAHPVITAEERGKKRSVAVKNLASALGVGTKKTTPHWGLNVASGGKGSLIPPVQE
jgi:hypothetical protein